jgi:hypothetical protein
MTGLQIDENSPSEDEAAAQAALHRPEGLLIHTIHSLMNTEYISRR